MNFDEKSVTQKRKALAFYNRKKRGIFYSFLFRTGLILFLVAFFACFGLISGYMQALYHSTPDLTIDSLTSKGEASILYDTDGKKIVSLKSGYFRQDYVSLKKIPQNLQNAVITSVDPEFYGHIGIDVYSIVNGILDDITTDSLYGKTSLITEHLIENLDTGFSINTNIFSRMEYRMRLHFKSMSLEKNASKPEILEYYLNTISFGDGIIGVEAASETYFGKSVSDLTLSECAILASTIADPIEYNPITQLENNKSRRLLILEKMYDEKYITEEKLADAIKEDSYQNLLSSDKQLSTGLSTFEQAALEQLYEEMNEQYQISLTKFYTLLQYGGLKIYTTQDTSVQNTVETILNDSSNYEWGVKDVQSCVTIIDQATGQVQAIVNNQNQPNSIVNCSIEEQHQPGTLFNLLATYLPGIDTGSLTLASSYEDAPYQYLDSSKKVKSSTNIYQGLTTIRQALPNQMNLIAARAQSDVTAQVSYDYLTRLGFRHLVETTQDTNGNIITDISQSICAGELINGVTNMEITSAVSALGNSGTLNTPFLFTRVEDSNGVILLEKETTTTKPVKETTAYLLSDALKVTEDHQIGSSDTVSLTGVSSDSSDYWCTGYTPELTATVWLGYSDDRSFESHGTEEKLWNQIMNAIYKKGGNTAFTKPSDLETADICQVSGKLAVSSICDHDPRGNQIRTEYFAPGTVPSTTCNTHVEVTICKKSGMLIGNLCPDEDKIQKIYLVLPSGSKKTLDYEYVLPDKYKSDKRCTTHTSDESIEK
jgi:penicillin-binding protein 1A